MFRLFLTRNLPGGCPQPCFMTSDQRQTCNPHGNLRLPLVVLLAQNTLATSRATAGIDRFSIQF